MLSDQQLKTLNSYKEKSYISSILCHHSQNHYNFVKQLINIPLIIFSAVLTVLNSGFDAELMKIPNIVVNVVTALILGLIGNFKINEKEINFSQNKKKFNLLNNEIQDLLINQIDNLDGDSVKLIISKYDAIENNFDYPEFIKNRIKKKFKNKLIEYSADLSFLESDSPTTSKATTPKINSITSNKALNISNKNLFSNIIEIA